MKSHKKQPVDVRIRNRLVGYAEYLKDLATQIGVDGKPLNKMEKRAIRIAFLGALEDHTNELEHSYVMGDFEECEEQLHHCADLMALVRGL